MFRYQIQVTHTITFLIPISVQANLRAAKSHFLSNRVTMEHEAIHDSPEKKSDMGVLS